MHRVVWIAVRIWALPTTLLGLIAVALTLATGGRAGGHTGIIEAHGGFARFFLKNGTFLPGGARAMTLGHVVIARDAESLEETRAHERIHVRQCERWGPLFVPAYVLCSAWIVLRRGNAYRDNPFEREAFDRSL